MWVFFWGECWLGWGMQTWKGLGGWARLLLPSATPRIHAWASWWRMTNVEKGWVALVKANSPVSQARLEELLRDAQPQSLDLTHKLKEHLLLHTTVFLQLVCITFVATSNCYNSFFHWRDISECAGSLTFSEEDFVEKTFTVTLSCYSADCRSSHLTWSPYLVASAQI